MALLDCNAGGSLWNTALVQNIPFETCAEIVTVFLALAARKAGCTPREACDAYFKECPPDATWLEAILPGMNAIAAGEE